MQKNEYLEMLMTVEQQKLTELTDVIADNWDTDPRHVAFKLLESYDIVRKEKKARV
jgi:hypothetical protein